MTEPTIYLCDDDEGVRSSIAFLLRQHDLLVKPWRGPGVHFRQQFRTTGIGFH